MVTIFGKKLSRLIIFILLSFTSLKHLKAHDHQDINQSNGHSWQTLDNDVEGLLNIFGGGNPSQTPTGDYIVDGDIVLPINNKSNERKGRKAIYSAVHYWFNGVVPYILHESITDIEKKAIMDGIKHWENETCIRFKQRSNENLYVRFRSDMPGCWSLVGRQLTKFGEGQDVSIGLGCASKGVVAHELGHVIGFYHEQSRSDRDKAVHILWENIQNGFYLQFKKESDRSRGVNYDYKSVMQYPSWAFSKDPLNKNTIVTSEPQYQRLLGKSRILSFRDKKLVNLMYQCNRKCKDKYTTICQNGGYLRYNRDGKACKCECPPNTKGENCQVLISKDYYEELVCGGIIDKEGMIETPNYPKRLMSEESCTWIITAPKEKKIELTIEGFEFSKRYNKPNSKANGKCFNETVEIRAYNEYQGDIFCGTDLKVGTKIISEKNKMIIIIIADNHKNGKGLKANVKFISSNSTKPSKGIKTSTTKTPKTNIILPTSNSSPVTIKSKTITTVSTLKNSLFNVSTKSIRNESQTQSYFSTTTSNIVPNQAK